jgi:hypothetical protein
MNRSNWKLGRPWILLSLSFVLLASLISIYGIILRYMFGSPVCILRRLHVNEFLHYPIRFSSNFQNRHQSKSRHKYTCRIFAEVFYDSSTWLRRFIEFYTKITKEPNFKITCVHVGKDSFLCVRISMFYLRYPLGAITAVNILSFGNQLSVHATVSLWGFCDQYKFLSGRMQVFLKLISSFISVVSVLRVGLATYLRTVTWQLLTHYSTDFVCRSAWALGNDEARSGGVVTNGWSPHPLHVHHSWVSVRRGVP